MLKLRKKLFSNLKKIINHDSQIYSKYNNDVLIIGLDEVGRGCVAGPVCTGAYSSSSFYLHSKELLKSKNLDSLLLLNDSKKVPHAKREQLCDSLLKIPGFDSQSHILHSTNHHSAAQIDSIGIVPCIWSSMTENVINIVMQYRDVYNQYPPEILLLVDGPKTIPNITKLIEEKLSKQNIYDLNLTELNIQQQAIIRGDSHSALIAAASNLAKLARDKHMRALSSQHQHYLWENNVGYGTKKHLEAIQTHGMVSEHRRSFLGNYQVIPGSYL